VSELEPRSFVVAPRDGHGRFLPGVSGNPGGRPKQARAVVELARQCTTEAIETLREIALDRQAQPMARVRACEALLTRAWGVPMPETSIDSLLEEEEPITFRIVLDENRETIDADWRDMDDTAPLNADSAS
jgi:hypothetical protein